MDWFMFKRWWEDFRWEEEAEYKSQQINHLIYDFQKMVGMNAPVEGMTLSMQNKIQILCYNKKNDKV